MIINLKPSKRKAECQAVRRVTEDKTELCLAPARILLVHMEPGLLCKAHAAALFLELKKDLGQ